MRTHWNDILNADTHEKLRNAINAPVEHGRELVECYTGRSAYFGEVAVDHFAVMRLPAQSSGR